MLAEVAECCGVAISDARLVHQHSNSAVALPNSGLLVRIASNPDALAQIKVSLAVTRWLVGRGYPTVEPATVEPFLVTGRVVSVWKLLDVVDRPRGTGADLGRLLRILHKEPPPPVALKPLSDPLEGVSRAVANHPDGMQPQDRAWLLTKIDELRSGWTALREQLRPGLVHGDAHSNNLLRVRDGGVLLGDWDHVAVGPREWDLVQPYYMQRRFGRHTEEELQNFAVAYGWDVRECADFETLIQVREVFGLSPYVRRALVNEWARDEVEHRLRTLRTGNTTARWSSPPRPPSP
ncbi:phosphotransferase [Actinomadura algeriensis]|uniref:Aminoglycoside phosphotransferase (APT) family kinase protein n=1 Tax=Actinomadura algeriensis TaxID=1679523 RepID=A0ABR9JRN6_9ACTN|nr:aminoglycoside phosphotransferase family protein [Actinomadura algeriensis]MBE1533227.1 aminoglycoside phosphotransferase (APT) family kinase protein [Actinomadura algeriensis]